MNKFKEMLKKLKVQSLLVAVALIVIGALFIISPNFSAMIICFFAGAVCAVWGALLLISCFSGGVKHFGSDDFTAGIVLLCIALLLFIKHGLIAGFITVLFGIALIVDGAVKIKNFAEMAKMKNKTSWAILVIAVLSLVFGAVLAFNAFSEHVLMIFAGVVLIVTGVLDMIAAGVIRRADKRVEEDSNVIDLDDDDIHREDVE